MRELFLILLIAPFLTSAQHVVIHFNVKNATFKEMGIVKDDYTNAVRLFDKGGEIGVPLNEGKGTWTHTLSRPVFVTAYYQDSITHMSNTYIFYVTPGDNLDFSFDAKNAGATYTVTGKGSKSNQPSIRELRRTLDLTLYHNDSLPDRVWKAIRQRSAENDKTLKDYVSRNRPGKGFEDIYGLYVKYFPVWTYLRFNGDQKYNVPDSYKRNERHWQRIQDSLTNVVSLNNPELLRISEYDYFLSSHLTRIKERLWRHAELLKDYYGTGTQEEAVTLRDEDPQNLLMEKIIDKHFSGKTAEFLYGVLFKEALGENEDNLPEIFSRFKEKYPQSDYIPYVAPTIATVEERRKRTLTDKMIFVDNNESYQTFEDLLKLVKGKTVLLDMWGTWCGSCRSELSTNSEPIKDHFKGKALEYVYVSNHDAGKEKKWKELISFYNLTGIHILASPQLTQDIMSKVKGDGFPTYVIIRKDGTFVLSEAGYPMDRQILIGQLERALAN